MARTFVALRPPDDVLDHVESVLARARRSIVGPRWTTRDQWHITLHFFGNVEASRVQAAGRALDLLGPAEPFTLRLDHAGAFPRPERARVLWIGSREGRDACGELAASLSVILATAGFAIEADRAFHPHLTLARLRDAAPVQPGIAALEAALADQAAPPWLVREAVLYESTLRRDGPVYTELARVALRG